MPPLSFPEDKLVNSRFVAHLRLLMKSRAKQEPRPQCGVVTFSDSPVGAINRNLYSGQEATVRTGRVTTDWLQIGKGVRQGCLLSPCLFKLHAEYIVQNARLDEAKLESTLQGEISVTSDMQRTPPLWQKVKRN